VRRNLKKGDRIVIGREAGRNDLFVENNGLDTKLGSVSSVLHSGLSLFERESSSHNFLDVDLSRGNQSDSPWPGVLVSEEGDTE